MSLLPRIMAGLKDGTLAFEVSQPNKDVLSAGPTDMLFSTLLDGITLLEHGMAYVPDSGTLTVPIAYGGRPLVIYQQNIRGTIGNPFEDHFPCFYWNPSTLTMMQISCTVGADNIQFSRVNNITGTTAFVYWQVWSKELV